VNEVYTLLNTKSFLNSLYGFAYKRTNNSYEAEDLCSEIILAVLSAARRNSEIAYVHAFVWTVARRVYADFSEKRRRVSGASAARYWDDASGFGIYSIEEYIETENDKLQLRRILREISFLSKIYRDVCVLYYLDELKVAEIAARLEISQNAVKQRLHSARKTIKKGVNKMDNLTLKPMGLAFLGTGKPVGNDPSSLAHRIFSKALLYLCKDSERSIKELSEALGVPMLYVEEEVYFLEQGVNGYYGLLKKMENGKYTANFIIVDYGDYMKVGEMYRRNTDIIAQRFDVYLKENEQKILNLPFLNKQTDVRFVAWAIVSRILWAFENDVAKRVEDKYFSHIIPTKRDFFTFGVAYKEDDNFDIGFYGCDGVIAHDIDEYAEIQLTNIYGRRLQKHFSCEHNVAQDKLLRMTIRAIKGLPLSSLSEEEKETAAKAIEVGYMKKENDMFFPKILVSEDNGIYWQIIDDFNQQITDLVEPTADALHKLVKKYVPAHLMNEYKIFIQQTATTLIGGITEKCIELGTLVPPEKTPSAEGVVMVVKGK
jgi:RNA polymerase sigma factor (sigma-70 family)